MTSVRRGFGAVETVLLLLHAALALRLRAIAWPEVTTPAYLISRGMLLYRDIKFVHTPGTMVTLALAFRLFGVRAGVVRAYALAGPLTAHFFLLRESRALPASQRIAVSAFFLALLYSWQGNSVWPTVVMTGLALPIARALERGFWRRAALLIGVCILFKQTAAYLLLLVLLTLLRCGWARRAKEVAVLASAPYMAGAVVFTLLGAGREYLEWTIVVPFASASSIVSWPTPGYLSGIVLAAFLPLVLETILAWRARELEPPWLFITAVGLCLICLPRFGTLQVVGAVPCLALGAARLLAREGKRIRVVASMFVWVLAVSHGAILAAGETFDGKVLFWNDDPMLERVIAVLRAEYAGHPVHSLLWPNLLPRAEALPPGRLYIHPWFTYDFPFDRVGERIRLSAARQGVITVGYGQRGASPAGARVIGPYLISVRE